jgi:hypothetical protein
MRKAPNVGAMLAGNDKRGGTGVGSTMLTGSSGVTGAITGALGKAGLLGS